MVFGAGGVHEEDTRSNVLVGARSHKVELERATTGGNTIGASVVGAIKSTVLRARGAIRAERGVPGIAGIAVGISAGGMQPSPVGIEHDRGGLGHATSGLGALLRTEFGMHLSSVGADLLCADSGE